MPEDFSDSLEELNDVFCETIEWAGRSYAVIASGAKSSSKLTMGGFTIDRDLAVTVSARTFEGTDPPDRNNTIRFTRYRSDGTIIVSSKYSVDSVSINPGGIMVFNLVADSKGI